MNPGSFLKQRIIVYGCGDALGNYKIIKLYQRYVKTHWRTVGAMIWAALAYDSRSTLILLYGALTVQRR